ncbi:MAG TPA: hypothetical protein VF190_03430, partial [Rhodothermales bacterium]
MVAETTADAERVAQTFHLLDDGRDESFDELARAAFAFQVAHNPVYQRFCGGHRWAGWDNAPHLPVAAFKEVAVTAFDPSLAERVFLSSATGACDRRSRHYVRSLDVYRRSFETAFARRFGGGPVTLVAHLPRYVEQGEASSLLTMVDGLMRRFGNADSRFFLEDVEELHAAIEASRRSGEPLILFGAAFGLLDLVESGPISLPPDASVIETGGMKTRRREINRQTLHDRLADGFRIPRPQIHSEYGMCELLSQCYTSGDRVFRTPPWMRFSVRDPEMPSRRVPDGEEGVLALFDLANVYSACAILTEDRAVARDGGFEVLGRLSAAELRGCNHLLARV